MDDRDRLDVPPRDTVTEDLRAKAWRRDVEDRANSVWPMVAVAAFLLAGLLFIANTFGPSNTQVGQNVERPAISTSPPVTSPPTPQ
jgi:hypothetical protein